VSAPTDEATADPYKTGGGSNSFWAGSIRSCTKDTFSTHTTTTLVTGFSPAGTTVDGATITVELYDADGATLLDSFTTPILDGNGTHTSPSTDLVVEISLYQADGYPRWKAQVEITVQFASSLAANGREGGRFHVEAYMVADTGTAGGATYTYTEADCFYDEKNTTVLPPTINGTMTISELVGSLVTRHISGIEYYDLGSAFNVTVTNMNKMNRNTQGRGGSADTNVNNTGNLRISSTDYGLPTTWFGGWINSAPYSGDPWTNQYDLANLGLDFQPWSINVSNWRYRYFEGNGDVNVYDSWLSTAQDTEASPNEKILIDTFSTTSTDTAEYFIKENKRLLVDYTTAWDSTDFLDSFNGGANQGAALVMGGNLRWPSQGTYDTGNNELGTINNNWTLYKPDLGGANPNYGIGAANDVDTQTSSLDDANRDPDYYVFYRKFLNAVPTADIASIDFTITGVGVNQGAVANTRPGFDIVLRKIASNTPGAQVGPTAPPLFSTGGPGFAPTSYNSGDYHDNWVAFTTTPPIKYTDQAANTYAKNGYARSQLSGPSTGNATSGNPLVIRHTFGSYLAKTGVYAEIRIYDANIRISSITATFI
jgi:hypothetical protein